MIIQIHRHRIMQEDPFIIAEAGINHNGDMDTALALIDSAGEAGADCIKFQTYKTSNLLIKNKKTKELFEELQSYELSYENFRELRDYAVKKNIIFMSTPDDIESLEFLMSINVPALKIGSGEIDNYHFLKKAADYPKPIIVSTGTASKKEIEKAYKIIRRRNKKLILMHCVSSYPASIEDLNLNFISVMEKRYNIPIGFSDHSMSLLAPAVGVAKGASVIEKHFTLDNSIEGPDHRMSLNPSQFREMVDNIHETSKMLGKSDKIIAQSEKKLIKTIRKSIYTAGPIEKGERISSDNTVLLRPAISLAASTYEHFLGKRVKRKKNAYKPLRSGDVE
ncbi:MAG: N-acetylneuraminate synthase family protein [candidate division WOR-3 bacterium]|nr:N-acetylneuraminate synthase family protein [candidate division WOR-3 bacterium]